MFIITNNSQVSPLSGYSWAGTRECVYIGMATKYMKIYFSCTGRLKQSVCTQKFRFCSVNLQDTEQMGQDTS